MATSYANSLGTGDRRGSVVITFSRDIFDNDDVSVLINGALENGRYVPSGTGFQGKHITFDFRTGQVIDEIRIQMGGAFDQGTWQPSGSNDGENFTNIGSPVAFTVAAPAVLAFTNSTSYRFYRITGSSGTVNQTYWQEVQFKIDAGAATYASSTAYANSLGTGNRTASITVTADNGTFDANTGYDGLVDGATPVSGRYVPSGTAFQGKKITFDFGSGASKVIDEIKLSVGSAADQATWQVSGSNNGTDFTNIGSAKTFPRIASTFLSFFNLTGYRYYRLTGSSGTVSQDYWKEVEFRIADYVAPPNITTTTLDDGTVGVAYTETVEESGGQAPVTFAVTSGALPDGLSLASGGGITGTPTTAGTFNFTVTATANDSQTDSQALSITIAAAAGGGSDQKRIQRSGFGPMGIFS
jgi:hypothetical protein